jgi:hypothetical protein
LWVDLSSAVELLLLAEGATFCIDDGTADQPLDEKHSFIGKEEPPPETKTVRQAVLDIRCLEELALDIGFQVRLGKA